jgi:hypothetical protein
MGILKQNAIRQWVQDRVLYGFTAARLFKRDSAMYR